MVVQGIGIQTQNVLCSTVGSAAWPVPASSFGTSLVQVHCLLLNHVLQVTVVGKGVVVPFVCWCLSCEQWVSNHEFISFTELLEISFPKFLLLKPKLTIFILLPCANAHFPPFDNLW